MGLVKHFSQAKKQESSIQRFGNLKENAFAKLAKALENCFSPFNTS